MKNLSIVTISLMTLVLLTTYTSGQKPTKKVTYKGGDMTYLENYRAIPSEDAKPWGTDVTVIYDTFFKNYEIVYSDSEGTRRKLTFEYSSGNGDHTIYMCNNFRFLITYVYHDYRNIYWFWFSQAPGDNPCARFTILNLVK